MLKRTACMLVLIAATVGLLWAADEKVLLVDDFDGDGPKIGSQWGVYGDENNLGTKINEFTLEKGGCPKSPKQHARFFGHLGKQKDPWPWANMVLSINDTVDVSGYTSIRFYAKGNGGKYRIALGKASIDDYSYYQYPFEAPKEWTLITAPLDKFTQPDWGKRVPREFKDVNTVQFTPTGDDVDFDLHVDQIEFVGPGK